MSQGREVFNLARTTYLRILPYLQPAAQVGLGAAVGALALGPEGLFPGAAFGAVATTTASRSLIQTAITLFSAALLVLQEYPNLVNLVRRLINAFNNYLENEEGQGGRALRQ